MSAETMTFQAETARLFALGCNRTLFQQRSLHSGTGE